MERNSSRRTLLLRFVQSSRKQTCQAILVERCCIIDGHDVSRLSRTIILAVPSYSKHLTTASTTMRLERKTKTLRNEAVAGLTGSNTHKAILNSGLALNIVTLLRCYCACTTLWKAAYKSKHWLEKTQEMAESVDHISRNCKDAPCRGAKGSGVAPWWTRNSNKQR